MKNKKRLLFLTLFFIGLINASCIEINSASINELDKIKWVGPLTAEAIINERPFDSIDDLIRVSGIGEIKLQDIKSQGLACVETEEEESPGEEDIEEVEKDNQEENSKEVEDPEEEIVNYSVKTPQKENKKINLETINLNPKDINTDSHKQKQGIDLNDYALVGFVIFSLAIFILVILRFRRFNKNEFK